MCNDPLRYPGFSIVFIQTFSLHHERKFYVKELLDPERPEGQENYAPCFSEDGSVCIARADELDVPIARSGRNIEEQIFILHSKKDEAVRNVRRCSLRGFDFEMPLKGQTFSGHCNVEMSLFFGHVVSLTYRFLFDGASCRMTRTATTDDLIALLSIWLSAEFWSKDMAQEENGKDHWSQTDINLESRFSVRKLRYGADGAYLPDGESLEIKGKGRYFDQIALRYKLFLYKQCTQDKPEYARRGRHPFKFPGTTENDLHYAMADIWENIAHPEGGKGGPDLFSLSRKPALSEAQIVDHIRNEHKSELIGLLTLYPSEWPYRDPAAYEEVCGENIAIDTDDLVLAGSSVCMVLGTYGRRGAESKGVDWKKHLAERMRYHVSWPEYLVILQMVLARKYVLGYVADRLIEATDDYRMRRSPDRLIRDNAELSVRLSRMLLRLDVVKMSKFPSHKVMYDRTVRRLELDADQEKVSSLMETLDNSLRNISDSKSARSENMLNLILGFISVASAFQLFFMETRMPFLDYLGIADRPVISTVVIALVAAIAFFAILYLLVHGLKDFIVRHLQEK